MTAARVTEGHRAAGVCGRRGTAKSGLAVNSTTDEIKAGLVRGQSLTQFGQGGPPVEGGQLRGGEDAGRSQPATTCSRAPGAKAQEGQRETGQEAVRAAPRGGGATKRGETPRDVTAYERRGSGKRE